MNIWDSVLRRRSARAEMAVEASGSEGGAIAQGLVDRHVTGKPALHIR
jgi:hypothetical protein